MEQPPEEAPEARPEEEKEEAAKAEGAPELNGGPEHSLPSSSYAGEGVAGDTDGVGTGRLACCEQHRHGVQGSRVGKGWKEHALKNGKPGVMGSDHCLRREFGYSLGMEEVESE